MRVRDIKVKTIGDSRGDPTIAVELQVKEGNTFSAKIPSGKSTGKREAVVLSPKRAKEMGEGMVKDSLQGKEFLSIHEFDNALLQLDSSKGKKILGGNLALGVSLAGARAIAFEKNQELWELFREEFFPKEQGIKFPLIFANLINGGMHAKNNLDIQEYMVVVPSGPSPKKATDDLVSFSAKLGEQLKENGDLALGDEAGYVRDFQDNREPLEILSELLFKEQKGYSLALDVAASVLKKGRGYEFEGRMLSPKELKEVYQEYLSAFPQLCSLEDPFSEDNVVSFKDLLRTFPKLWIVGDDITATRQDRIGELAKLKAINGVIIKANQVGTVTETCEAMKEAKKHNLNVIVSHRSGETDDHFLVSFARAANAEGVKIGAPARERLGKYEELVRLYASP